MTQFDPAAATAAYLAQLPPEAHARAAAYTQGGHWLLLWSTLATVAAAFVILKSGLLARLERRIESSRNRPLVVSFVLGALYFLLDWVLELPWASYANWWREKSYGLNNQTWLGWFRDNFIQSIIGVVFAGIFFVFLYLLIRRAPRWWPVWTGGLTAVFMLLALWAAPMFIEPLLNSYQPAPPGPVRDMVVALGKANGVPTDKIYVFNGSKQSDRYTANVAGLFGTARVALSDTMFKKGADVPEVKAVVGHEMGHYVLGHIIPLVLANAVLVIAAGFLVQWLFPPLRSLLGASEVGGVADPAGLPVVMIIAALLTLLATPFSSYVSRLEETQADDFSLEHAREPDGLARALVKTIEYRAATPSALEEFLFYDHPSVGRRIRRAMDWKAAHGGEPADSGPQAGG